MKCIIALTAVAGFVTSIAGQYIDVLAVSLSPIHLLPWNANGGRIWLEKPTASYCPLRNASDCPIGNTTNYAPADGTLAMGSLVPGGQRVYIDPECGALMFTQAHSARLPTGAVLDGWSWDQGDPYGFLAWRTGLLACSTGGDADEGPWEIYAQLDGIEFGEDCIGLNAITVNDTQPAAWQYI